MIRVGHKLLDVDERLKKAVVELAKQVKYDIVIVCGVRGETEQNEAYKNGYSQVKFPNSKHNTFPSKAVDIAPYIDGQIPWSNTHAFIQMQNDLKLIAKQLGYKFRWGMDWKTFKDYPHVEVDDDYDRQMKTAQKYMKRYESSLKELAKT